MAENVALQDDKLLPPRVEESNDSSIDFNISLSEALKSNACECSQKVMCIHYSELFNSIVYCSVYSDDGVFSTTVTSIRLFCSHDHIL